MQSKVAVVFPISVPPFNPDRVHDDDIKLNSPSSTVELNAANGCETAGTSDPSSIFSDENTNSGFFSEAEIKEANRLDGIK